MLPLNVERLLREGTIVLARPNGLTKCTCGIHYRPSWSESKFCQVCIQTGANLVARKCAYKPCSVTFTPHNHSARYHSASCRQLAYDARKRAAA